MKICARCSILFVLFAAVVHAQEQSVHPGINDHFQDPDVDRYVKMFEGESRAIYHHRAEILDALALEPGQDVADIGAGTGFFSMMFADKVGPKGTVYAVDIAKNFIDHIKENAKEYGHKNVKTVLCTERDTKLKKKSIDVAFICDTYHHFEYPFDTMASIHDAMRDGGKLMIVDFERVKGVQSDWTMNHVRCGKGTVTDEVKDAGFDFVEEVPIMEDQYVIVFRKRAPADVE
jgi:ubiquinone/menaquinone biosynthesis C-methylase UbiE